MIEIFYGGPKDGYERKIDQNYTVYTYKFPQILKTGTLKKGTLQEVETPEPVLIIHEYDLMRREGYVLYYKYTGERWL